MMKSTFSKLDFKCNKIFQLIHLYFLNVNEKKNQAINKYCMKITMLFNFMILNDI